MEPKKYDGWLVSNSVWKRSFAVAGHFALAQLITAIPIWILMGLLFSWFAPSLGQIGGNFSPETYKDLLDAYTEQ